jgi:hypothetical protein
MSQAVHGLLQHIRLVKNKIVIEWDMPHGEQSRLLHQRLLACVTQCVGAAVPAATRLAMAHCLNIFIHSEHEEPATVPNGPKVD